ncbi:DUF4062 domain-containing protein [Candidatus Magnetominusculus dajiuhuensis]|uniref:DUF4062 domain-containing protein n=1 Tax=Candidatus Magnetominusculus dajiuhuensis TaxID=3137712 RepID=UPI003B42A7FD
MSKITKIMISSTSEDLIEHRKFVMDALQRMTLPYSAMEFFGSRTEESEDVCYKEIEKCDYLVGIYAWRYGWIPGPDGLSITEKEYDYAKECGVKRLCYIIDECHPWPPKQIEGGDAPKKLKAFKSKVSKVVRSTFTTPDNLAKQVAADLFRELSAATTEDSEPLPADNNDEGFNYPSLYDNKKVIGRDRFITELKKTINDHNLLTLCGIGGVGKTAVAIKACKDETLQGQFDMFFIPMERLGANSSEGQFIDMIAEATGLPEDARKSLDALIAAIKTKSATRPVLLLFDNYESIDEVKGRRVISKLTDVKNLKILVTSRTVVGIDNVENQLELKPLKWNAEDSAKAGLLESLKSSDSYQILKARVRLLRGRKDWEVSSVDAEHVKSVLETTCGIPLAIELVASRMVPSYTWQEAATTLRESLRLIGLKDSHREGTISPDRHLSMEACLNWSYERLSEPAQRLFRAISLFANGFETKLVEKCYGQLFSDTSGVTSIRERLDEIEASSLISSLDGKWSFLPIVHRYAKYLLNEDEGKSKVEAAFISYWDSFVKEYSSSDEKLMSNLKSLEQEHGHLTEFLNLLLANRDNHDMFMASTTSLGGFWYIKRMWGDSISYLESAIKIARDKTEKNPDNYQPQVASTGNNLAILLSDMGDMGGAKGLFEEALRIIRPLSKKYPDAYLPKLAVVCHNFVGLLEEMGEVERAAALLKEADDINKGRR